LLFSPGKGPGFKEKKKKEKVESHEGLLPRSRPGGTEGEDFRKSQKGGGDRPSVIVVGEEKGGANYFMLIEKDEASRLNASDWGMVERFRNFFL